MAIVPEPVLVVGSVAVDAIITPRQTRDACPGGSAVFFAMAASYFAPVRLVGVIGDDFPDGTLEDLRRHGVDLEGLQRIAGGKTFRWKGRYHENMNQRDTLETHLNVFENFEPKLPASYRKTPFLFLANIQPTLQLDVLEQAGQARLVGMDTMNLWIDIAREDLARVLAKVDVLTINEEEALQLSGEHNLVRAARTIQGLGPKNVVVKRGEYGAMLFHGDDVFVTPALPLDEVIDPTGAGDSFAGGFMGYLARIGDLSGEHLRRAMIYGTVLASYCVQGFSYEAMDHLTLADVQRRFDEFSALTDFSRAKLA
ncbi:MAG: sugar kinase [Deltaproteobacteria bacterium]|nr:MAG: sugar kinase [Deltaproteobacteria bacterium]